MYIVQNVYLFYTGKVLETFKINCEEVRRFFSSFRSVCLLAWMLS